MVGFTLIISGLVPLAIAVVTKEKNRWIPASIGSALFLPGLAITLWLLIKPR